MNVARSAGAWRWAVAATGVAVLLAGGLILSLREGAAPPWQNPLVNATFTRFDGLRWIRVRRGDFSGRQMGGLRVRS